MRTYIHKYIFTYIHKYIDPTDAAPGPSQLQQLLPHRPVFNLLFDAMTGVGFSSNADKDRWNDYDPTVDFERGGEVGLADVVGSFLLTRCQSSFVAPPPILFPSFRSWPPPCPLLPPPPHMHAGQCAHKYLICLRVCVYV